MHSHCVDVMCIVAVMIISLITCVYAVEMVNGNSVDGCRLMYNDFVNSYERLVAMIVPRSAK